MLMNLKDQNAIFFKNVNSRRLNILYRRYGNIGWVDPKMKLIEFISLDSIHVDIDVDSKKNLFKHVSTIFSKNNSERASIVVEKLNEKKG